MLTRKINVPMETDYPRYAEWLAFAGIKASMMLLTDAVALTVYYLPKQRKAVASMLTAIVGETT